MVRFPSGSWTCKLLPQSGNVRAEDEGRDVTGLNFKCGRSEWLDGYSIFKAANQSTALPYLAAMTWKTEPTKCHDLWTVRILKNSAPWMPWFAIHALQFYNTKFRFILEKLPPSLQKGTKPAKPVTNGETLAAGPVDNINCSCLAVHHFPCRRLSYPLRFGEPRKKKRVENWRSLPGWASSLPRLLSALLQKEESPRRGGKMACVVGETIAPLSYFCVSPRGHETQSWVVTHD